MKPIDQMSAVELCDAIKVEGARLGVKVSLMSRDGVLPRVMAILAGNGHDVALVWLSWEHEASRYPLDELREGLRRWMSLRGDG